MRVVLGLILVVIGALITIFNEGMLETFGRVGFAEEHFSTSGGSRLFYQLLGVVVAFVGMTVTFNLFDKILYAILAPVFIR